jgi:hypothetical protein
LSINPSFRKPGCLRVLCLAPFSTTPICRAV